MKRKHKIVTLIVVLLLAMATLVHVNLQNVRDPGRPGFSSMRETRLIDPGQWFGNPEVATHVESE